MRYILAALGVVVALAALPLLYGLAYLVMLESARPQPGFGGWFVERQAHFRFGGEVAEKFFAPALRVDRRLRPAYWEFDPWSPTDADRAVMQEYLR